MTDPSESAEPVQPEPESEAESDAAYASVVHVDRHDDVATICGRIDTAPSYAVVVHAPGGNRALSREIGMRRVIRHADETGKALAFATTSVALSSRARSLGIPVARKPEHVRWDAGGRVIWRIAGKSIAVPAFGRLVQVLVIVGIAVGLAALAFTMGPSVTVIAYPPSETLDATVLLTASENFEEIDLQRMRVPAEQVTSSRLVTVVVPVTGTAMVGTDPAMVTVTVTNTTADEVTIPAGALVNADAEGGQIQFELLDDIELIPGETGVVAAQATTPGTRGNIPPDSITGFVDSQYALIRAANAGNAGGGADGPRPAVDQVDIITLRDTASLLETAQAIKDTIVTDRPRDAIFVETASVQVERGDPSDVPGMLADVVSMEVQVTVTAVAIRASVLDEIARQVLRPTEGTGEFIAGTVSAVETGARQVDADSGAITAEFRIRGEFARNVSSSEIADAVKGRSAEEARSILQTRYGIDEVEVDLSPSWAPRLPRFGFRIDVEFRNRPAADDSQATASSAVQFGSANAATTSSPVPGS
jgi:hypothetical protein